MKKFLPLLGLLAAPVMAQGAQVYFASDAWPVEAAGRGCRMMQSGSAAGPNALEVGYDAGSGEVTLTMSSDEIGSALRDRGTIDLAIVFLQNGETAYDDAWGSRSFAYVRDDGTARFTTRFAGERNVRQILADLAHSHDVGLLHKGQAVMSTNLTQAGRSLGKLQECGRRAVAAN
jgi:hypothetical protein